MSYAHGGAPLQLHDSGGLRPCGGQVAVLLSFPGRFWRRPRGYPTCPFWALKSARGGSQTASYFVFLLGSPCCFYCIQFWEISTRCLQVSQDQKSPARTNARQKLTQSDTSYQLGKSSSRRPQAAETRYELCQSSRAPAVKRYGSLHDFTVSSLLEDCWPRLRMGELFWGLDHGAQVLP